AAATSVGAVAPLFLPYLRAQREFGLGRALEAPLTYSAGWQACLAASARAPRWVLPWLERWSEVLFPGFLLTALALAGLVVGLGGRHGVGRDGSPSRPSREGEPLGSGDETAEADGSESRPYRETTVFYALVGGIAF